MDRRKKKHAKRLLLVAMSATSVSGCATGQGIQVASQSPTPTAIAVSSVGSANSELGSNDSESKAAVVVKPAGYNDGIVIASPAIFAQAVEESEELGVGSQGVRETWRQGNKEGDKDDETDSDSQTPPLFVSPTPNSPTPNSPTPNSPTLNSPTPNSPTPNSPTAPVEFFVSEALSRHPKILAARQRVAAASNVIPQAKALPDPTFNNTFWPLHDNVLSNCRWSGWQSNVG